MMARDPVSDGQGVRLYQRGANSGHSEQQHHQQNQQQKQQHDQFSQYALSLGRAQTADLPGGLRVTISCPPGTFVTQKGHRLHIATSSQKLQPRQNSFQTSSSSLQHLPREMHQSRLPLKHQQTLQNLESPLPSHSHLPDQQPTQHQSSQSSSPLQHVREQHNLQHDVLSQSPSHSQYLYDPGEPGEVTWRPLIRQEHSFQLNNAQSDPIRPILKFPSQSNTNGGSRGVRFNISRNSVHEYANSVAVSDPGENELWYSSMCQQMGVERQQLQQQQPQQRRGRSNSHGDGR